jgi:hypothetical protein
MGRVLIVGVCMALSETSKRRCNYTWFLLVESHIMQRLDWQLQACIRVGLKANNTCTALEFDRFNVENVPD